MSSILSDLPQLFTFSVFAPTLLRIVVALSFFYIAYAQASRHKEIAQIKIAVIGHIDRTLIFISALVTALLGLALLVGWHTQYAAIVGILLCLKHAVYAKKYPRLMPLCRLEYIYLIVILFTLVLTGAGLVAMDIPGL